MDWREVCKAEYLDGFRIEVWFNDGILKIVDLADVIENYPVFKPLSDLHRFKKFRVTDTLEWEDGRIDIAPEYLYENGIQVGI